MRYVIFSTFAAILAFTLPATAGDRVTLGFGRLLLNDWIGDGHDRWRSGSGVVSVMRGSEGSTGRPAAFGELLEFRFAGGNTAPADLASPDAGDRPYAGMLSLGLHSHFTNGPFELSLGVDLVATGPQTGLADFQSAFHDFIDENKASPAVVAGQIANGFHPTALAEIARPVTLGPRLTFRPFLEAQAGVESFARIGGDLLWGGFWQQGVFLRDTTTGQRYQSFRNVAPDQGTSLLVGADVAKVFHSALLPSADGYQLTPIRARARLGLHWQGEKLSVFYGITWLGREFEAQPEGQFVGAIRVGWKF